MLLALKIESLFLTICFMFLTGTGEILCLFYAFDSLFREDIITIEIISYIVVITNCFFMWILKLVVFIVYADVPKFKVSLFFCIFNFLFFIVAFVMWIPKNYKILFPILGLIWMFLNLNIKRNNSQTNVRKVSISI